MKKLRFLVTFLGLFALLLVVWSVTDGARWFTQALLLLAGAIGPMVHGWILDTNPPGGGLPVWVYGSNQVPAQLQFDALAIGLVPVLALLGATPGLRIRRRALLMLVGAGLCLLIDTLILVLFPLLVFYQTGDSPATIGSASIDVLGTFLGLVGFVGAPVIIWFALTFRELQPLLPSFRAGSVASPSRPR